MWVKDQRNRSPKVFCPKCLIQLTFSQEFLFSKACMGRNGVPLTVEPGISLRMHGAPATLSRGSYCETKDWNRMRGKEVFRVNSSASYSNSRTPAGSREISPHGLLMVSVGMTHGWLESWWNSTSSFSCRVALEIFLLLENLENCSGVTTSAITSYLRRSYSPSHTFKNS